MNLSDNLTHPEITGHNLTYTELAIT